jgi:hypothetical protein
MLESAEDGRGSEAQSPEERLDSWKEISQHLKRTVRTVQRWEQSEGLPIHRIVHHKHSTVYAYAAELDEWWRSRQVTKSGKLIRPEPEVAAAPTRPSKRIRPFSRPALVFLLAAVAAVVSALVVRG